MSVDAVPVVVSVGPIDVSDWLPIVATFMKTFLAWLLLISREDMIEMLRRLKDVDGCPRLGPVYPCVVVPAYFVCSGPCVYPCAVVPVYFVCSGPSVFRAWCFPCISCVVVPVCIRVQWSLCISCV